MSLTYKIKNAGLSVLAKLGIPRYQFFLAQSYFQGDGGAPDAELAVKWCEASALQGYAPAEVLMGQFHVSQFGVACDQIEIFKWFESAAKHGDAAGMHHLAWCYEQGIGVLPNPKHAFRLWLNAASRGFPSAQFAVANCFYSGVGTTPDLQKALVWCKESVKNGAEARANILLKKIEARLRAPLPYGE